MDVTTLSAVDLSALITAGVALATAVFGGIFALWGRIETINKRTQQELEKCRQREIISRERRSVIITAFEFVIHALCRHDPEAPEINQSRLLIEELKVRDKLEAELFKDEY